MSSLNEDRFALDCDHAWKKARPRRSGDFWALKLALEISDEGLGFKPGVLAKEVSKALVDNGKLKSVVDAQVAKWEAGKLGGVAVKSSKSKPVSRL